MVPLMGQATAKWHLRKPSALHGMQASSHSSELGADQVRDRLFWHSHLHSLEPPGTLFLPGGTECQGHTCWGPPWPSRRWLTQNPTAFPAPSPSSGPRASPSTTQPALASLISRLAQVGTAGGRSRKPCSLCLGPPELLCCG
jgi:hypothetical protein